MLTIRSRHFQANFDAATGNWEGLLTRKDSTPLLGRGPALDLQIDGNFWFTNTSRQISATRYFAEGRGAAFICEVDGIRITHAIELDAALPIMYQSVDLQDIEATERPPRQLTGVVYQLPGFVVGDPQACLLYAPDQGIPESPYPEAAALLSDAGRQTAPAYLAGWPQPAEGQNPGLVAVENTVQHRLASCWLRSENAKTFTTVCARNEQGAAVIDVAQRQQLSGWLKPGVTLISQGFSLLVTDGSLEQHLAQFQRYAYEEIW